MYLVVVTLMPVMNYGNDSSLYQLAFVTLMGVVPSLGHDNVCAVGQYSPGWLEGNRWEVSFLLEGEGKRYCS